MNTLPDFLAPDLEILSIGLNPSPNSVTAGFPFATPQNRFWRAFNASQLVSVSYPPGIDSMEKLLRDEKIGFTDVVKRPTPGARDLSAADYRLWAPRLLEKLTRYRPRVLWFQGKIAYRSFARHALGLNTAPLEWGAQATPCGGIPVFVTPNPSPANAAYSLEDIVAAMDTLAEFLASQKR